MNAKAPFFKLEATSNKARAGVLTTSHSRIETPVFMPVGTRGTVKSMTMQDMEELGAEIILGNTYHLYLRPGMELMHKMGGLHQFSTWKKSILTDSGGYQVFSLSKLNKIIEEGVHFKSHIDGSSHFFTPELSMSVQKSLGSDIVMCFDECPALPATRETLEKSMKLTLRWSKRCRDFKLQDHQHLFGIIQGGLELDLRKECFRELDAMGPFAGYALGGLSVGEKNEKMVELLHDFVDGTMPVHLPRYLMGVGKPLDILNAVREGVDLFDCVIPTRNARNGGVFTIDGPLNIKNVRFKEDSLPLDPDCHCKVCKRYSRSYIRHLFLVGEYTAGQLLCFHNLHFYLQMMRNIRKSILDNQFEQFYQSFKMRYLSNLWQGISDS